MSRDSAVLEMLFAPALDAAPRLLGAVFRAGDVAVRITEVEAYQGQGDDPGSHAHRGRTARNGSLWAEPGTVYVYLSYGIHRCVNLVCGPEGYAFGVLLRAGEIVDGLDVARRRRPTSTRDADLARGPGRLGTALAIDLGDDGARLGAGRFSLERASSGDESVRTVRRGPRVGVSGVAGGAEFSWRFWLDDDPTVSPYRAAVSKRRRPSGDRAGGASAGTVAE